MPSASAVFLVAFGALALVGYRVSKAGASNGGVVAGVAGMALLLAGGGAGLFTGLLVVAGAAWGFIRSF